MRKLSCTDVVGKVFTRLTVETLEGVDHASKSLVTCRCECGKVITVRYSNLTSGCTKSCGCLAKEVSGSRFFVHGLSGDPRHQVWVDMIKRCYSATDPSYQNYGARGIKVHDDWLGTPEQFYKDMGARPESHTLERRDNSKGYSKSNCYWATMSTQQNNKRTNLNIEYLGTTLTATQWARLLGVHRSRVLNRYHAGYPLDLVLLPGKISQSDRAKAGTRDRKFDIQQERN